MTTLSGITFNGRVSYSLLQTIFTPVASFSKSPVEGTVPLTVSFTDTSSNTPTSWLWDFGDSTTSTSQNPSHQYTVAGSYNVTLTATNTAGSDMSSQTVSALAKTYGTLWTWGRGVEGQLGNGSTPTSIAPPINIGADTTWKYLHVTSNSSVGIKTDNSTWWWGGVTSPVITSPTQVAPGYFWEYINVDYGRTRTGLGVDGTIWAWGTNSSGQCGLGTITAQPIANPTQIGTANDWVEMSSGAAYTHVIKADGSLWGWGSNGNGALGTGNNTSYSSPVRIGTENNWKHVFNSSHVQAAAIKTDGTLWMCGINSNGQLGIGSTIAQKSFVQVGTDTDWVYASCNYYHTIALKSNGTLWGWGKNTDGALGDGGTAQRTVPGQIGTDTDWVQAEGGSDFTIALKSNGTLWSCGDNTYKTTGRIGSPGAKVLTQIGTNTNWVSFNVGQLHVCAIAA